MTRTGDFVVKFYNRYGGLIKGKACICDSYLSSRAKGAKVIAKSKGDKDHCPTSFTIGRRLFNSLDNINTWE